MSTRGFLTLVIDGQEKTGFNHWDSYPSGFGIDVLQWLRDSAVNQVDVVKQRARDLRLVTKAEATDADVYDVGRDVGTLLAAGSLVDCSEFPLDSLFAEWGYVIDFDAAVFEVYRGFQTASHDKGRFASRPPHHPEYRERLQSQYWPVALIKQWPFSALPMDRQFCEWAEKLWQAEEEEYEKSHDGA